MQTIVQFLDCLPSGRRSIFCMLGDYIKLGVPLRPAVTVTTRRLLILVGCAYKPSLASVAGTGSIPIYITQTLDKIITCHITRFWKFNHVHTCFTCLDHMQNLYIFVYDCSTAYYINYIGIFKFSLWKLVSRTNSSTDHPRKTSSTLGQMDALS